MFFFISLIVFLLAIPGNILLPQGFFTFCPECSFPGICIAYSLTSFRVLLKWQILSRDFLDYSILNVCPLPSLVFTNPPPWVIFLCNICHHMKFYLLLYLLSLLLLLLLLLFYSFTVSFFLMECKLHAARCFVWFIHCCIFSVYRGSGL